MDKKIILTKVSDSHNKNNCYSVAVYKSDNGLTFILRYDKKTKEVMYNADIHYTND